MAAKKGSWIDLILSFGAAVAIPLWAWSHRPFEFRDTSDLALIALLDSEKFVLKEWAFYLAILVAVASLAAGIRQVLLLQKDAAQA